jgi:hypothetical protein
MYAYLTSFLDTVISRYLCGSVFATDGGPLDGTRTRTIWSAVASLDGTTYTGATAQMVGIAIAITLLAVGLAKMVRDRPYGSDRPFDSTSGSEAQVIRDLVSYHARQRGLDEYGQALALAICSAESSFTDPTEVGPAGEIGPMQITPPAMSDIGVHVNTSSSLDQKIFAGVLFLHTLLDQSKRHYGRVPYGLPNVYTLEQYRLACRAYNVGFRGASRTNLGYQYLDRVRSQEFAKWL